MREKKFAISALFLILSSQFIFSEIPQDLRKAFVDWEKTVEEVFSKIDDLDEGLYQGIVDMVNDLNYSEDDIFPEGRPAALDDFQRAYLNIYWLLAPGYEKAGNNEQALICYQKNYKYHSNPSHWVFTKYASVLDKTGQRAVAKEILRDGLNRLSNEEKPNLFWDLCMYEYLDGNNEDCLLLAEEYLQLESSVPGAFVFASLSAFALEKSSEAMGWFSLALELCLDSDEYDWLLEKLRDLFTDMKSSYGDRKELNYVFALLDKTDEKLKYLEYQILINKSTFPLKAVEEDFVKETDFGVWNLTMLEYGLKLYERLGCSMAAAFLSAEKAALTSDYTWDDAIGYSNDFYDYKHYKNAITWAERAVEMADKEGGNKENERSYSLSVGFLALLYMQAGQYSEAELLFIEVLSLTKEFEPKGQHPDYIIYLNDLASLYDETGRYSEAELLYEQALSISRKLKPEGQTETYAQTIHNLATLYFTMGRYSKALPLFKEVVRIIKILDPEMPHQGYISALNNLAICYDRIGQDSEAEPLYKEVLDLSKGSGPGSENPNYLVYLNNLMAFYFDMERYTDAERISEEALAFCVRSNSRELIPGYTSFLHNMASLKMKKKEYLEAEKMYLEALGILKELKPKGQNPKYAKTLNSLAVSYAEMEKYAEARPLFEKSLSIILNRLDNEYYSMSEKERSQFQSTVSLFIDNLKVYTEKAHTEIPETASFLFNVELRTKGSILRSTRNMRKAIIESNDQNLISDYKRWLGIKEAYAKYLGGNKDALAGMTEDSLKDKINSLEKDLSRRAAANSDIIDNSIFTWTSIRDALKPGEAVVEILRYPRGDEIHYAAMLVSRGVEANPVYKVIAEDSYIENAAMEDYRAWIDAMETGKMSFKYFNLIERFGGDDLSNLYTSLYETFWQPIEELLTDDVNTIYFCPDGVYNLINLQTLKNAEGVYLSDFYDFRIVTNPSEVVAQYDCNVSTEAGPPVLVGFPDYEMTVESRLARFYRNEQKHTSENMIPDRIFSEYSSQRGGDLKPLAGALEEIRDIANILEASNVGYTNLFAEEASEEALKAIINPEILHITTHGFFLTDTQIRNENRLMTDDGQANIFNENPLLRSGVYLAGAGQSLKNPGQSHDVEDGILTAYEVMNLDLYGTKLVVLSACETGLGEVVNGEGVYGLQRAFLSAGADAVLMSLWKVDDEATKELMVSFYRHLYSGEDTRTAYNNAITELREAYEDAYYWGAFVLVE